MTDQNSSYLKKIPALSGFVYYLRLFYQLCGARLAWMNLLTFFSGFLDVIGISLLFPLLTYGLGREADNPVAKTIFKGVSFLGLPVNLVTILLFLLVVFLLKGVCSYHELITRAEVSNDLRRKLRMHLTEAYFSMRYLTFTRSNIGFLTNTITLEVSQAVSAMTGFSRFMLCLVYLGIYSVACIYLDWKIALMISLGCGIVFFLLRGIPQKIQLMSNKVTEQNAKIQSLVIQALENFKYLKATYRFPAVQKIFFEELDKHRNYDFEKDKETALPSLFLEPLMILCSSAIILYYVYILKQPLQSLLVQLLFFSRAISYTLSLMNIWNAFGQCTGGLTIVQKTLKDLEPEQKFDSEDEKLELFSHLQKEIRFQNVSFSYGSKQVLRHVNLEIQKNRSVAIVGRSGSGKTTLVNLITGLLEPDSGEIMIDGTNCRKISKKSLRSRVGYVTQEVVMFHDTLLNNISLWEPRASLQKVQEVGRLSHCEEFVQKLEKKYETVVGDRGIQLSGGQRQRIGIARELYRDPEILIFDEATSSLDSSSEMHIQQSIKSLMGKKTIILVTHRLSTIKNCDQIYVMEQGEIVESGTFETLNSNPNSQFYRMCREQFLDRDPAVLIPS